MQNNPYLLGEEPQPISARDLNKFLEHCTKINASDITIQTSECIVAEVYGKLYPINKRKLNNAEVGTLLNAIYGPNGTTQILSGKDLDTNYEFKPSRLSRFRYRVNATGCLVSGQQGIQITLRTIPTDPPLLDGMDLPAPILNAIAPDEGVVYVTGATGSGKSTLLASIIRNIAEDPECHRKILTYESPIEFVYDNINALTAIVSQSEIPLHLPSFAAGVRNALRRKPRLILVGEARDAATISAVLEAAMTGHPVYTTLHTNGVPETIRRLVGSYGKEERAGKTIDIIETMRLIIWQKLVPTLDGKRTALREYLVFNEEVRDILLSADPIHVTAQTRKCLMQYGQTMLMDAQRKFDEGLIEQRVLDVIHAQTAPQDMPSD